MFTYMFKSVIKSAVILIFGLNLFATNLQANEYPNKPINFVVGSGMGGSIDRMTRSMSTFLSDELNTPIKVINKKGAGTQIAANYVLKKPADGYTVFSATFSPFLVNSILSTGAKIKISDFNFINLQWFDYELFAVTKNSKYNSMIEILNEIKKHPKTLKVAISKDSVGHLLLKLMLDKYNIPQENLNLILFNSGGKARTAIATGEVDLIAISAKGSESIRKFIKPLAIVKDKRVKQWDAPTLNEAIKPLGFQVPIFDGSMKGFAVRKEFKEKYPERYVKLVNAIKNTLEKKGVQKFLKANHIEYTWTGPKKSNQLIQESYNIFKSYAYLVNE